MFSSTIELVFWLNHFKLKTGYNIIWNAYNIKFFDSHVIVTCLVYWLRLFSNRIIISSPSKHLWCCNHLRLSTYNKRQKENGVSSFTLGYPAVNDYLIVPTTLFFISLIKLDTVSILHTGNILFWSHNCVYWVSIEHVIVGNEE